MGSFTTTTAAAFIKEEWLQRILIAREAPMLVQKRIVLVEKQIQRGDIVHFPNIANITDSAIAADGSVTATANTETDTTLTINTWRGTGVDIPLNVWEQSSQYDLAALYGPKLVYGTNLGIEDRVYDLDNQAAITTSGGATVGADNQGYSEPALLQAIRVLDVNEVPEEDRSGFFYPTVIERMRGIRDYTRADATGQDNPGVITGNFSERQPPNAIKARYRGTLFGLPIWATNRVNAGASGRQNWVMHYEALGLAMQKRPRVTELPVARLAKLIVSDAMYGMGVLRGDHAVIFLT